MKETASAMNDLLQRVQQEGSPLIDGETVTFLWHGESAPYLVGDFNNWGWKDGQPEGIKLTSIGENLWVHRQTLPADAYIEYNFVTTVGDDRTIQRDPYNSRLSDSGIGHDNHYLMMPAFQPMRPPSKLKHGKISKHVVQHPFLLAKGKRDLWLYHPPTDQAVPFLLVYDGKDYQKRAMLAQMVDDLIARQLIQPLALAFLDHGKDMRVIEYAQGEATLFAVLDLVLPLITSNLHLVQESGAHGVLGASMGGLMALHSGLRAPEIFGHVISQSGAFWETIGSIPSLIRVMVEHLPTQSLKIWQDVGVYEALLADNRSMHQLLQAKGYTVTYREYHGGHNYTSWRNQLPEALITMFGKKS